MKTAFGAARFVGGLLFNWIVPLLLSVPATTFVVLLVAGVGKAAFWREFTYLYVVYATITLAEFVLLPRELKSLGWILSRLLLPPALAGFAEMAFLYQYDLEGYIVTALAFLVIVVVFTIDRALVVLAVIASIVRKALREEPMAVFEWLFRFMDRLYLRHPKVETVAWDETLELVVRPHPLYIADQVGRQIPEVYKRASTDLLVVPILGLVLAAVLTLRPWQLLNVVRDFSVGTLAGLNFEPVWWPLVAGLAVAYVWFTGRFLGVLLWEYLHAEWNRRTSGAVVFRDEIFVVGVHLEGWLTATPSSSRGSVAKIGETKIIPAGEESEEGAGGALERLWDSILGLHSGQDVNTVTLPVAARGGGDRVDLVSPASGIRSTLLLIREYSAVIADLRREMVDKPRTEALAKTAIGQEVLTLTGVARGDPQALIDDAVIAYAQRLSQLTAVPAEDFLARRTAGWVINPIELLRRGVQPLRWDVARMVRLFQPEISV